MIKFKKRSGFVKEALSNASSGAANRRSRASYLCKMVGAVSILVAPLFVSSTAFAAPVPLAILQDVRASLNVSGDPISVRTVFDNEDGFPGITAFGLNDLIAFASGSLIAAPLRLGGLAFVGQIDTSTLLITTIYGVDINPADPFLRLSGFNFANPQIKPLSSETLFSRSGIPYTSSFQAVVPLSDIGTFLPGFNLSPFSLSPFANGDPGSLLYLFQTTVPTRDFLSTPVPEPSTMWMMAGVALMACRWYRRPPKAS